MATEVQIAIRRQCALLRISEAVAVLCGDDVAERITALSFANPREREARLLEALAEALAGPAGLALSEPSPGTPAEPPGTVERVALPVTEHRDAYAGALSDRYTAGELKTLAAGLGVDLAGAKSKAAIASAFIESGAVELELVAGEPQLFFSTVTKPAAVGLAESPAAEDAESGPAEVEGDLEMEA